MTSTADVSEVTEEVRDNFPYSGMRLMAVMQINVGVLVFVLGLVDLVLTNVLYDENLQTYGSGYHLVVSVTVVSSPLWCGLWFCITGTLGAILVRREREPTLVYCKTAYLLLNVMCCALFGPACAALTGFISYTRHKLDRGDYQWLICLIICFLAIIEVIMAAVSASMACCYSTLRSTQIHIYVNQDHLRSPEYKLPSNRKSMPSSCPGHDESDKHFNNNVNQDDLFPPRPTRNNGISPWHQLGAGHGYNRFSRQLYRSQEEQHSRELFEVTSSYSALKKWALPSL